MAEHRQQHEAIAQRNLQVQILEILFTEIDEIYPDRLLTEVFAGKPSAWVSPAQRAARRSGRSKHGSQPSDCPV